MRGNKDRKALIREGKSGGRMMSTNRTDLIGQERARRLENQERRGCAGCAKRGRNINR
jgi:hypothetical protein